MPDLSIKIKKGTESSWISMNNIPGVKRVRMYSSEFTLGIDGVEEDDVNYVVKELMKMENVQEVQIYWGD